MCDIEEVKEIIESSGNNFQCRVMSYLKSKDWHTVTSHQLDTILDASIPM